MNQQADFNFQAAIAALSTTINESQLSMSVKAQVAEMIGVKVIGPAFSGWGGRIPAQNRHVMNAKELHELKWDPAAETTISTQHAQPLLLEQLTSAMAMTGEEFAQRLQGALQDINTQCKREISRHRGRGDREGNKHNRDVPQLAAEAAKAALQAAGMERAAKAIDTAGETRARA